MEKSVLKLKIQPTSPTLNNILNFEFEQNVLQNENVRLGRHDSTLKKRKKKNAQIFWTVDQAHRPNL